MRVASLWPVTHVSTFFPVSALEEELIMDSLVEEAVPLEFSNVLYDENSLVETVVMDFSETASLNYHEILTIVDHEKEY